MAFGIAGEGDAVDAIIGEQPGLKQLQAGIELPGRIVAVAADDMGAVDAGLAGQAGEHVVEHRPVPDVARDDMRDRDHAGPVQADRRGDHVVSGVARHGGDEHPRLGPQDVLRRVERLVIARGQLGGIIVEQPRQGRLRIAIVRDRRHTGSSSLCLLDRNMQQHIQFVTTLAARKLGADGKNAAQQRAVPVERPIAISFLGIGYAVMMATPADLEDFAYRLRPLRTADRFARGS